MSDNLITKKMILDLREKGMTKPEIAKHFGISIGDVNSIFAAYNISGRPAKKKKYKLEINENGDPVLNQNNATEEELEQVNQDESNV
jgi:transposase